jgi:DNA-binding Lrp family transcriptional regulator
MSFRLYVSFQNTNTEKELEIQKYLKEKKEVTVLAVCLTKYDLMVSVVVKSIYDFQDFWTAFKTIYKEYIHRENISIFTKVIRFTRGYLNKDKESFELQKTELQKISELQKKILKELSKNTRISAVEIAKNLNENARTIAQNIKMLSKNKIVLGYGLDIDLRRLNRQYYKFNVILNSYQNLQKLKQITAIHSSVIFYNETIGNFDFEIDVEVAIIIKNFAGIQGKSKRFSCVKNLRFLDIYRGLIPRHFSAKFLIPKIPLLY